MKTSHVILIIAGLLAVGVVLYLATRPSTGDDGSGGSGDGSSGDGGPPIGTDGTATSRPAMVTRIGTDGTASPSAPTATIIGLAPGERGGGRSDPNR